MQGDRSQQRNRERGYLRSQSRHSLPGPEKSKRLVNEQTRLPSLRRRSEGPGGILECFHQGLVEPPFPKSREPPAADGHNCQPIKRLPSSRGTNSKLRKQPKDETIHQLLNAILGEIGRTQGGTATKFRAFQCLHLNQSVNKCQAFLTENARERTRMNANKRA